MKLSVITDEISQDFEHALGVMAEYGVVGAELRGLWGTNIGDLDDAQVRRAREALADAGAQVTCLASPFYKCDIEDDAARVAGRMHLAQARGYSEQLDLLRRLCDLAHRFDTDLIRVFSFWRRGPLTHEIEKHIVDALQEPAKIAASEGLTLVLENEHACYLGTGAEVSRVVAAVDSPALQTCWDPGNALAAGEVPFPDGYASVRSTVRHIHIKDGRIDADTGEASWCVVGDGSIDYAGHFAALRKDGYTGWISLETHYRPPNGSPEDGSKPCLASLKKMLEVS